MAETTLPTAYVVMRAPLDREITDLVTLGYDERMLRRKRLITAHDEAFLVDLAETVSLNHGDAFQLSDGRLVQVVAAVEPLMELRGDLARLAWHIGNRHAPCQIEPDRLLIRRDRVLRLMLEGLGAQIRDIDAPFRPDGGAYGHGRTLGHAHEQGSSTHGAHDYAHAPIAGRLRGEPDLGRDHGHDHGQHDLPGHDRPHRHDYDETNRSDHGGTHRHDHDV